jgi:Txe/YoeB family toxin of Txe-Axe toxin-antitoxin module
MKKIVFEETAFQDFNKWSTENKKLYQRIVNLIKPTTI